MTNKRIFSKFLMAVTLGLISAPAVAMAPSDLLELNDPTKDAAHSYNDIDITPETLEKIAPMVPEHVKRAVEKLKAANPGLLPTLMQFDKVTDWYNYIMASRQALAQHGTPSKEYNYVVPMSDDLETMIANHRSRMVNCIHDAGKGYDVVNNLMNGMAQFADINARINEFNKRSEQMLADIPVVTTYQSVSPLVYGLKLEKANKLIKQATGSSGIVIPEPYLVRVNDKPGVSDASHIVVQQSLPSEENYVLLSQALGNLKNSEDIQALLNKIPDETVLNLLRMTVYAGLWAVDGNIFVNDDGFVCVTKVEQPDNSKSHNFFHKKGVAYSPAQSEDEKYQHNVTVGISGLYSMFKHAPTKRALIQYHIANSSALNNFRKDKRDAIMRSVELEK